MMVYKRRFKVFQGVNNKTSSLDIGGSEDKISYMLDEANAEETLG
jgi:hypothetical protein